MTLNDLERRSSRYFALFHRNGDILVVTSYWLKLHQYATVLHVCRKARKISLNFTMEQNLLQHVSHLRRSHAAREKDKRIGLLLLSPSEA